MKTHRISKEIIAFNKVTQQVIISAELFNAGFDMNKEWQEYTDPKTGELVCRQLELEEKHYPTKRHCETRIKLW